MAEAAPIKALVIVPTYNERTNLPKMIEWVLVQGPEFEMLVVDDGSQDGTGILWASYAASGDAEHTVSPGILRAFDATDVRKELWNNQQNASRDASGTYAKFAAPTIANGHVYLPTFSSRIVVYGLQ